MVALCDVEGRLHLFQPQGFEDHEMAGKMHQHAYVGNYFFVLLFKISSLFFDLDRCLQHRHTARTRASPKKSVQRPPLLSPLSTLH
jgi:hypothetical protein